MKTIENVAHYKLVEKMLARHGASLTGGRRIGG